MLNKIQYRRVGNHYIPNLIIPPEEASVRLGKWGMLHKDYLLKNKKVMFEVFDRIRGANGKKHVPIKIHFVGVGVIQFPDAEMLEKTKEEMKAYSKKAS